MLGGRFYASKFVEPEGSGWAGHSPRVTQLLTHLRLYLPGLIPTPSWFHFIASSQVHVTLNVQLLRAWGHFHMCHGWERGDYYCYPCSLITE